MVNLRVSRRTWSRVSSSETGIEHRSTGHVFGFPRRLLCMEETGIDVYIASKFTLSSPIFYFYTVTGNAISVMS